MKFVSIIFKQRWAELLEQMNWQTDQLREDRYDAVIHLVSAAIGAEEYYNLNTNEVRKYEIQKKLYQKIYFLMFYKRQKGLLVKTSYSSSK